jgi:hypothetical protein
MEPLTNGEREFMDWLTTVNRDNLPKPPYWHDLIERIRSAATTDDGIATTSSRLGEIGYLYYLEEERRRGLRS